MDEAPAPAVNKYAGNKTEKNLEAAFAGESQARNKYTYFASVAKREGFEQLSEFFLKTAGNEKEHAEIWFKELGHLGTTAENPRPPRRASTTSGRRCTRTSPRTPKPRAFRSWPPAPPRRRHRKTHEERYRTL